MPSLHISAIAPSEPRSVFRTLRRLAQCVVTSPFLIFAGASRCDAIA